MSFGEKLKERRLACHMTMESLAILVGTSRQTIQRYESGRISRPPYERIEALAAALGVSPGELMGWQRGDVQDDDMYLSRDGADLPHIVVTDDSMDGDRILERDVISYRSAANPPEGTIMVVRWQGKTLVRRVWHCAAGLLLLASNSTYPPILVEHEAAEQPEILGQATVLHTLL